MIDLHLHTTASDGQCSPAELVTLVRDAGITTLAVTDHDTMAGVAETAAHAAQFGLAFVPGIELTSVHEGHDVHMLGYWVESGSPALSISIDELRAAIAAAGGIASLAHPGTAHLDELIPQLVADGLAAIEVYHSSHDEAATVRYRELAALHQVAVTGGSDFHGPTARRAEFLGRVGLSPGDFARLVHRAGVTNLARA